MVFFLEKLSKLLDTYKKYNRTYNKLLEKKANLEILKYIDMVWGYKTIKIIKPFSFDIPKFVSVSEKDKNKYLIKVAFSYKRKYLLNEYYVSRKLKKYSGLIKTKKIFELVHSGDMPFTLIISEYYENFSNIKGKEKKYLDLIIDLLIIKEKIRIEPTNIYLPRRGIHRISNLKNFPSLPIDIKEGIRENLTYILKLIKDSPLIFSHNDFNGENILYNSLENKLILFDFEKSDHNYIFEDPSRLIYYYCYFNRLKSLFNNKIYNALIKLYPSKKLNIFLLYQAIRNYEFINIHNLSKKEKKLSKRYLEQTLKRVILDKKEDKK